MARWSDRKHPLPTIPTGGTSLDAGIDVTVPRLPDGVKDVLIALGSNMGNRESHLRSGLDGLQRVGELQATSAVYETSPVGLVHQDPFLNAALWLRTGLGTLSLLMWCKSLEFAAGRRPGVRQGPRPLDIDIVSYDNVRENSPRITLPHPRVSERPFMLAPLSDIAPDTLLPGGNQTIGELDQQVGRNGIIRFHASDQIWAAR